MTATRLAAVLNTNAAQEMGLTEQAMERRQQAVGFGAEDLLRLARVGDLVRRNAEALTEIFFVSLSSLEEARGLLQNREALDLARKLKHEHLLAMVGGHYGVEYAEQRLRLGLLYSQVGLEPRVFLGAFNQLLRGIGSRVFKDARAPEEGFEDFMSLNKVAFLDIGLIVDKILFERERTIRRQQEAIHELSTPVLQIRDRLLMLPIIGVMDTHRARLVTEALLDAIRAKRAKVVVIDITGVAAVDTKVANHLLQTVAAAKLMGATVLVTGISAEVAQTLVNLGVDLGRILTISDLQGGIEEAERMIGYHVSKGEVAAATSLESA